MPELPEVEVTRQGVAPHLVGKTVKSVVLRHLGLRWPFPPDIEETLRGRKILDTARRGKYLLLEFSHGFLIIHLGMSGRLSILPASASPQKHDQMMRLTDPRRFGAVLWHAAEHGPVDQHPLLRSLGIEPFDAGFSGEMLYRETRMRSAAIKQVLLAGDIVVGVGNIYASESLFHARINPNLPARRIGRERYAKLVAAIRRVLAAAIEQGGSTLRDFAGADGRSGYFQQQYFVYDRAGLPCRQCGVEVRQFRQGQRSTFYCVNCQK
jgi:formamidopyrimidine-DNA glycosylase